MGNIRSYLQRLAWVQSGLFWRTFFLLALLVTASMTTWFVSIKLLDRKPRAQQLSNQIVSIVTITSAALTHSAEERRRELLIDLARSEGIRIYLLEDTDQIEALEESPMLAELRLLVQQKLGKQTRFAQRVNGEEGFWVSFKIDDDQFWLRLEQDRLQTEIGWHIFGWAASSLVLALIAAALISRRINAPLSDLSAAARQLARGNHPSPLKETGPREIRETNTSFNQMVDDLARIELDRTVILAGISHDLRTPLTRLQLELEMANLDNATRDAMQIDLRQMDSIIQQFLDYAKPLHESTFSSFNLSSLLEQLFTDMARDHSILMEVQIVPNLYVTGIEIEVRRLFNNLIQNALRYGRNEVTQQLKLQLECRSRANTGQSGALIYLRDFGAGIIESEIPRLLRPFTRGEVARSQANGSGLGLAIVDRIVKRHGGKIQIQNHEFGGLEIYIELR
ncbi:ATP-binding protein [Undibacterium flavidum]|uniref:histidine kinase n=1 Tax=Undibacterium flavidum TaxID=2762297 RepID=A0ABR6YHJ2_9BURK|nr:ATP-binding protein [Undibacterium flavidum]MBC3875998.1 HAMP domain-containing protein [Undibacterium flavidum]